MKLFTQCPIDLYQACSGAMNEIFLFDFLNEIDLEISA